MPLQRIRSACEKHPGEEIPIFENAQQDHTLYDSNYAPGGARLVKPAHQRLPKKDKQARCAEQSGRGVSEIEEEATSKEYDDPRAPPSWTHAKQNRRRA